MTHQEMIYAIRQTELYDAPEYLIQRAIALFESKWSTLGPLVRALLTFDSWSLPELVGVRSTERGSRQLVYQTDSFQIYILLMNAQQASMVIGQVVPKDPVVDVSNYLVALQHRDRIISKERTNSQGEFLLTSAKSGAYTRGLNLIIYAEKQPIEVNLPN